MYPCHSVPKATRWLALPAAATLVLAWACSQSESTDMPTEGPAASEAGATAQAGSSSGPASSGGASVSGGGEPDGESGASSGEAGSVASESGGSDSAGSGGRPAMSAGGEAGASDQPGSGGAPGLRCNPNEPSEYSCTNENAICEYGGKCYVCSACQLNPSAPGLICSWFLTECEQGGGGASGSGGSAAGSGGAPSGVRCGDATCEPGQYCRAACSGIGGDPGPPSCQVLPAECNGVATCECVCGETSNFCEEGAPEIQCGCA